MSRLRNPERWRPAGYDPALLFWLRDALEGGDLRSPGDVRPAPDARRECLVLVHGYNNHAGEAATAYFGFRAQQHLFHPDLQPGALERRFADTFWPGDADWPGPVDWLDALFYPFAVRVARDGAPILAETIRRMPNLERVDFVGHSLGCRLILETAVELLAAGSPAIARICLMAAAVPSNMVEPGGRFDDLLTRLAAANVKIHVMHSNKDPVLKFSFPPGQALAGEPSIRALGLTGPPADMIGRGGMVSDARIAGAKHGHYWGHQESDAREQAVREAGTFLRIGETVRSMSPRTTSEPRDVGAARAVGTPRTVDA